MIILNMLLQNIYSEIAWEFVITQNIIKENIKITCTLRDVLKQFFFVKMGDIGCEQQYVFFKAETSPVTNSSQNFDHKFKKKDNINV